MSSSIPKEEMDFYKGLVKFLSVFAVPGLLVWGYYSYYVPHQECEKAVQFYPEIKSVESDDVWVAKQGRAEYYSYTGSMRQFKTRGEALNDCNLQN